MCFKGSLFGLVLEEGCMVSATLPRGIVEALQQRAADGALRVTQPSQAGVDLCSNDYLGIARELLRPEIVSAVVMECAAAPTLGATGSRLVSGTTDEHQAFETFLANYHYAERALLFGSGYEANVGLLSALGRRTDTVIYDDLVHASMRDGIRLSLARSFSFRHNDLEDLRQKLKGASGECYVAVESVYSMDGHRAPLRELCTVCEEFGAHLIVDEAHASGMYGPSGEGLVVELELQRRVFARVHTFGKALGYRGACVVGSELLQSYLVNFARPFIYSTAPDVISLAFMREAYRLVSGAASQRRALTELIACWRSLRQELQQLSFVDSDTAIQGIIVPGNHEVLAAERRLQDAGFFAKAIRSPTVPRGSERLRISLHSYNSAEELRSAALLIAHSQRV
jgi:8-amino-7-oxononanoate synthase